MARRPGPAPDGVIVVDKPQGPTSHDVVARLRRLVRPSRAGHTGTLDPMATGVLPVCIGAATRLSRFLGRGPKEYTGRIVLGVATDTYDGLGHIVAERPCDEVSLDDARGAAHGLTGPLSQVPPPWSAKKLGGRRAYDLARAGETHRMEPCSIHVERFELCSLDGGVLTFRVVCSPGTYVRSLAHDLGERLGCGAHLAELRRTRSGPFGVEAAVDLARLMEAGRSGSLAGHILPMESLDLGLETARLTAGGAASALSGRCILPSEISRIGPGSGAVRLLAPDGRLLGVAEPLPGEPGKLQPRVILAAGRDGEP